MNKVISKTAQGVALALLVLSLGAKPLFARGPGQSEDPGGGFGGGSNQPPPYEPPPPPPSDPQPPLFGGDPQPPPYEPPPPPPSDPQPPPYEPPYNPPYYPPSDPPPPPYEPPYYPPSDPSPPPYEPGPSYPGDLFPCGSNLCADRIVDKDFKGFNAVDLLKLFDVDQTYNGLVLKKVIAKASASCGYQSLSLVVNGDEVREVNVGKKVANYNLMTANKKVLGKEVNALKIYMSGCFNLKKVQLVFESN